MLFRLWDSFYLLIVAKCIRYYENHGRGWHYETEPMEGLTEETVDREVLNGAAAHLHEADVASDYEEGDTSVHPADDGTERLPEVGPKPSSHFTPVNSFNTFNSINHLIQDDDSAAPEPAAEDSSIKVSAESNVPHRSRKRTSLPPTASPAMKKARTSEPSIPTSQEPFVPKDQPPNSAHPNGSHSNGAHTNSAIAGNNQRDQPLAPHVGMPQSYNTGAFQLTSGTHPMVNEVLGPFMDSPVVSQLIGPNGPVLARPDWERLRSVFENVPATRVDAQALVAELSKKPMGAPAEQGLGNLPAGIKPERQASPAITGSSSGLPSLASIAQPSPVSRFGEMPRPGLGAVSSNTGLPNGTSWRAASYAPPTIPHHSPPQNGTPTAGTPIEHRRSLEMTPSGGADAMYSDALERAEIEIDWWAEDQPQGFIQLEAGDDATSFFRKIEEEMPPKLKDRAVRAVRVEHLNPPPNSGRAFNARIRRGAEAGYKALARRLRQLKDGSTPELMVTVEWEL